MNAIIIEDTDTLVLSRGSHKDQTLVKGQCLLEAVSIFAGGEFTDCPECVDETLAEFGRTWNDSIRSNEDRAQLKQYIPRLPDTEKGDDLSIRRGWMCVDWLIRHYLAIVLSALPELVQKAEFFKSLEPITSTDIFDLRLPHIYNMERDENFLFVDQYSWNMICNTALDAANEVAWHRTGNIHIVRIMDLCHQYTYKASQQENFPAVCEQLMASSHDLFSRMIEMN